jgi:tetratricopeptide (TPR) repeat protein
MTDDDIDEFFKEKWIKNFNLFNNNGSISDMAKLLETEQNIVYSLKFQGKFYFIVGDYKKALADLTKLLELEPNNAFALRYQAETYYMIGRYEESLVNLDKLLETNAQDIWASKFYEEVTKE